MERYYTTHGYIHATHERGRLTWHAFRHTGTPLGHECIGEYDTLRDAEGALRDAHGHERTGTMTTQELQDYGKHLAHNTRSVTPTQLHAQLLNQYRMPQFRVIWRAFEEEKRSIRALSES